MRTKLPHRRIGVSGPTKSRTANALRVADFSENRMTLGGAVGVEFSFSASVEIRKNA